MPVHFTLGDRPTPVFVIGDSHTLPYRDQLMRDPQTGKLYIGVARYIPGLRASDFTNDDGEIAPAIIEALASAYLTDRDCNPTFTSFERSELANTFAMGMSGTIPIVIFSAGDIDARSHLTRLLGGRFDVLIPGSTEFPRSKNPTILPLSIIAERAERMIAPLVRGLEQLRERGFSRLFLLLAPPPSADDRTFEVVQGFFCPLSTRFKVATLFNQLLRRAAENAGIRVIDLWPHVIESPMQVGRQYFLDGVHLNRLAATRAVEIAVRTATEDSESGLNARRYELLHCARSTPPDGSGASTFAERGWHSGPIDGSEPFPRDASAVPILPSRRLDWLAWTSDAETTFVIPPPPDTLHGWLGGDVMQRGLSDQLNYRWDVYSTSSWTSTKDRMRAPYCVRAPEGVAILYLVPELVTLGVAPIEGSADENASWIVDGPAWVLIDPRRHAAWVWFQSPDKRPVITQMLVAPRLLGDAAFRLIVANGNAMPADPTFFTMDGMFSVPPTDGSDIRINPFFHLVAGRS